MALSGMGRHMDPVVQEAVGFLIRSVRDDGSWPIDTNLATWVTTLSVKALGESPPGVSDWLLSQQYRTIHPYTLSPPGGWAWTDLPGGVPDADDTSGALLALRFTPGEAAREAAAPAARWLLGLQNSDGGIPTFCRGWGTLPFDRSTAEITAHAAAALHAWRDEISEPRVATALPRMMAYLTKTQHSDGWWEPLWFGNEHTPDEANPVYGTAAVLKHLTAIPGTGALQARAAAYLINAQRADGAWGGAAGELPPSIEETSAALEALALAGCSRAVLRRGTEALLALTKNGTEFTPAPIGLYFARLWYHERLYPLIAATAAFRAVLRAGV
jgi:squalene-hopene/tetraprenyl-beta-curcumene cyclase